MELKFSLSKLEVVPLFKAYRNDIDIFTEDEEEDREFYKVIFNRLLKDTGVRVSDVYPLGTSRAVIEASRGGRCSARPALYLVDGDIFLLYCPKSPTNNLFVLDSYCIENLVVDEKATYETIKTFLGTKSLSEIKSKFKFSELIDGCKKELIDLFFIWAIQCKYTENFKMDNIGRFYNNKTHDLSKGKIKKRTKEIENSLIDSGKIQRSQLALEISKLRGRFSYSNETFFKIVSGKDYLMPLLSRQARRNLNLRFEIDRHAWKYNLASHCNMDRFASLKEKILLICSQKKS